MVDKKQVGFGVRLAAMLIDCILIGIANSILGKAMPFLRKPLFNSLISGLYSVLLWVNWNGQTVGKRVMGIKVVLANGKVLDYQAAVFRYLGYIISAIPLGLGFFWVLIDEKKQGWHDKLAKTLVVKE